jgi:sphinganine C4-monooxygenase
MNQTECALFNDDDLCFLRMDVPFYYATAETLISGVPDVYLAMVVPIVCYWALSIFFHIFDTCNFQSLEKYRIHDSEEVKSRNLASRTEVICYVLAQQVLQVILGWFWLSSDVRQDPAVGMVTVARVLKPVLEVVFGVQTTFALLSTVTYWTYWWFIPAVQFLYAW